MHPYVLVPMISAMAAASFAAVLLSRDPLHTRNRYAALLLFGTAYWALCEVRWNTAPEAETALLWIRISAIGWVWIGPLWLRLFSDRSGHPPPAVKRILPWMFAGGALGLVLEWTTPWMHSAAVRRQWGWAYEVGPVFAVWYLYCISLILLGVFFALRDWREAASPAERRQRPWLLAAVAIPLVIASLTDGILPILSIQVPRLGTATLAVMGGLIVWSQLRYGYSVLVPGNFAREILDTLPEGVALVSLDGRIRSLNTGLARLCGVPIPSLLGRRLQDLIPDASLEPSHESREFEISLRGADGSKIPVAVSTQMLCDKKGFALGLVIVVRDMREVTALRSRLITSGRLAAVGQLAAGIAHEINNPLAFVRANLALLQEHWEHVTGAWRKGRDAATCADLLDEGSELIGESLEGVDRTAAIVRDVKRFSHAGNKGLDTLDLNALLEDALRIISPQLRGRIEIERSYTDVPPLRGSSQEMRQVFVNLLANAAQAIGERGVVRVKTELEGNRVAIVVEDTGSGIPPELVERIFDPFFTTKPVGEGTGLGLAISHEIVRRHEGSIDVTSQTGRGTSVRVRLPITDEG